MFLKDDSRLQRRVILDTVEKNIADNTLSGFSLQFGSHSQFNYVMENKIWK